MLKRGSECIGLPVLCLEEGCRVTTVKDVLYCNQNFHIFSFLVQEGGYFYEPKMIFFKDILEIHENSIKIQSQKNIHTIKRKIEKVDSIQSIIGLDIRTSDDNTIGMVQDVMIETETGRIVNLVLAESLFDDLMEGRPYLPVTNIFDIHEKSIRLPQNMIHSILYDTGGIKKKFSLE
ncbi:PRC-barrel domain-containing protein [Inediibacterium massiliense]|uniref:PRC-barrel domain-containing protein n=1 Tax=Inediibacterium massiliense TaxID=1658111 RepID=UPI0006B5DD8A|nr:PRC-barrel domain-containing protein [Inediibacterium massiliense]